MYYSGKHHRHDVNIQFLTGPHGRLIWASPALPGSAHDLTAARARHHRRAHQPHDRLQRRQEIRRSVRRNRNPLQTQEAP
ncbi:MULTISPECIES: transposase family protein [Actinomadura]|uniref:transposase family protein n=1 Tax=unclassified Actinomadura TaxID=2626254 RepID=UPI003390D742